MKVVNKTGYLKGAKTAKNPVNIIPSNLITTQGMAFPIKANGKTLYPNTGQYKFNTPYVVETPLKQDGADELKTSDAAKFTYRIKDKKRRDTQVADMYNNTLDSFRGDTTGAKRHFKSFFTHYGSERFDGVRPLEGYYGFDRKDYNDKILDSLGRDWHKQMRVPKKQKGSKNTKAESKPSWFNTPIEFGKKPGSIGRYIGKALTLGAEPPKGKGYSITPSTTLKGALEDYVTGEVGGAVIKRAMPYVKPIVSKAAKPIIDRVAPVANKVTSTIKNIPNYLRNIETLADEGLGRAFRNKGNKKAIAEGNQWLQNWINHPRTQAKIDADLDNALAVRNKVFDREVELLRRQSKTHKPSVKEYPFKKQLQDLKKGEEHIHSDNSGVSYTHDFNPYWRDQIKKGTYTPTTRYGDWVSRNLLIPQKKRVGTTIHEGTHGWASDDALKISGMRDKVLKEMPDDVKDNFLQWESLNSKGIDPATVMGKNKAYEGYIADPTEMHARIMEVRKHFGLTPDDVIDENRAHSMMTELMNMPYKKRPVDMYTMSKTVGSSPKSFANLMNKMWAVPAVGAAGLAVKENKQGSKNMKPLIKYKDGSKSVSLSFSRKEKDPKGGLTQKGVDKYNRATGGNLKMAVTTPPSKLKPGSKAANRRKSFCARMSGVKGPMEKNGKPTRKALALRKWNC